MCASLCVICWWRIRRGALGGDAHGAHVAHTPRPRQPQPMGWSGLIGDWTTFTLALLIMAQDPTLLQILPPLLVILALCLLPWRGGASLGMNKAQRASLLAAPAAGSTFGAVPATSSMLGAVE